MAKNPITDDAEITVEKWNEEDADEAAVKGGNGAPSTAGLVVFSRDWTVGTIVDQVAQGNLDLDPDFQRRNAWRDPRRSALIESFILNFPVPQIVLAENPAKPKSFVVIDGKQRLMTLAGFFLKGYREYWTEPKLSGLKLLKDFNDVALDDFLAKARFADERRQLTNADLRATIISGFKDQDVLYDIFYRLNTGSVALSSQELRQVLNRGDFSRFLVEVTDKENALWSALGQDGPDPRLRDVELLLRLIAVTRYFSEYQGNMKPFLDLVMGRLNSNWRNERRGVEQLVEELMAAVRTAIKVYGDKLGRKFKNGRYEGSVNRALFEVQTFYFQDSGVRSKAIKKAAVIRKTFETLCSTDLDFLASIESTTKSIENYRVRFGRYSKALGKVLGVKLQGLD
jgi:hypothetical protein